MPTVGDDHIVKSYDAQLKTLRDILARMGGLAEAQLDMALAALEARDSETAMKVKAGDAAVDACEQQVNEQTLRLLALRAPLADDLRQVVAALKVAGNLERVADHAASAARRTVILNDNPAMAPTRSLVRMGRKVQVMLHEVLGAYLAYDADTALAVHGRDQEIDEMHASLFREILTYMMEDARTITAASQLMFVAKTFERIGDHATNIAEMTYFLVTARPLDRHRPRRDVFDGGV
ncbi:phosphate signaling complex protein PhoU [Magnetospirillum sp. UT-4]|uniref:phosphate signaling complex protein PhoU n=1 Tax=Magnetospirillum sp. UT-4 TaxID=2681467 RepID=UPI001383EB31|nr:phosphate signaling complex protein PhoU [Magnetospirillum sp. UT-4]CAA7616408.1 Phosphate-specific transport system accessory protein PhoU homolog [Magnetospirillum sp. UT-4]